MKAPTEAQIQARMENNAIRTCLALEAILNQMGNRWWAHASETRMLLQGIRDKQKILMEERRQPK